MSTTAAGLETMIKADLTLIDRHRHGDPAAFEEFYDEFADMVYRIAFRLSGNAEDAADLSQETFLKIHRHMGSFKGRSSLRTWVYRVALNCCRSGLRSRSKRESRYQSSLTELDQLPALERSPEEETVALNESGLVTQALRQVKSPYRETVILRDLEGLSYREIADVLRVRIGTVRSRIARGREQLREILEDNRR